MTISDATELRELEFKHKLRLPKSIKNFNEKNLLALGEFNYDVASFCVFNKEKAKAKLLKSGFVKKLTQNNIGKYYYLETKGAKGLFFSAYNLFKTKKYPENIIQGGYCFQNCLFSAFAFEELGFKCDVISGISWLKSSFMHSVVLVENSWVVDYNLGIVMQKDLYFNVFAMEILEKVSGEDYVKNKDYIMRTSQAYKLNFCFKQYLKVLKDFSDVHNNQEYVKIIDKDNRDDIESLKKSLVINKEMFNCGVSNLVDVSIN